MATDSRQSFSFDFTLGEPATAVFEVLQQVNDWWSGFYGEEIVGSNQKEGEEFTFLAAGGAHFSRQRVIEIIPNAKIVWLVTESNFSYIKKSDEWTGTKIRFDISEKAGQTHLRFTHKGLVPNLECYESCSRAWSKYLEERLLLQISKQKAGSLQKE